MLNKSSSIYSKEFEHLTIGSELIKDTVKEAIKYYQALRMYSERNNLDWRISRTNFEGKFKLTIYEI